MHPVILAYQSGKLKTYSCDQIFQAVEGKFVVLSGSFYDLDYLKSILRFESEPDSC